MKFLKKQGIKGQLKIGRQGLLITEHTIIITQSTAITVIMKSMVAKIAIINPITSKNTKR